MRRNPPFSQAEGLHDRTAKSAGKVAATARAPGAGVRTTATGERRGRLRTLPSRHSRSGTSFCAANSTVFRTRSASDGAVTRDFPPCLIFGTFGSSQKYEENTLSAKGCGAQRRAGRSLRPRRPAKKACAPQASTRRQPHIGARLAQLCGDKPRSDRRRLD